MSSAYEYKNDQMWDTGGTLETFGSGISYYPLAEIADLAEAGIPDTVTLPPEFRFE